MSKVESGSIKPLFVRNQITGGFIGRTEVSVYILVAEKQDGDQNIPICQSDEFLYSFGKVLEYSKQWGAAYNFVLGKLSQKGWKTVREPSVHGAWAVVEAMIELEEEVIIRRVITDDQPDIASNLQALQLLHSNKFVTDEEFLAISKRIRDL